MAVQKMGSRLRLSYCALFAIFLATGVPEGMATSPDAATKAFDRGAALLRQGDLPAAAEAVRKAIELNPSSAEAYRLLGQILFKERNPSAYLGLSFTA